MAHSNNDYVWTRIVMGFKCEGSHFQRAVATGPLKGLLYNIYEQYIDDVLIYGSTAKELLTCVDTVFKRI